MGALLQAMGGDGQGAGAGQPQQPLTTPYGQRNPQDQMMSMAGLLLASGMPLNKAIPQASQMMQQQQQSQMQQMQMMQYMQKMQAQQQQAQGDQDLIGQLTGGGGASGMMANPQMNTPSGEDMTLAQSLGNQSAPTAPAGNMSMGGANALPSNGTQQSNSAPQTGRRGINDLDPETRNVIANTIRVDRAAGLKMLNEALNPEASPLQKEIAKKDAETISTSEADVKDLMGLKSAINSFKVNMKGTPDALMGRGIGVVAPYLSNSAQAAEGDANTIALIGKKMLSMPSNNFSDADRDFLVNATVGLNKSKEANSKTITRLEDLINKQVDYTKDLTNRLATKGNLRGVAIENYDKNYGSGANQAAPANMQQNKRSVADLSDQELMTIANGR